MCLVFSVLVQVCVEGRKSKMHVHIKYTQSVCIGLWSFIDPLKKDLYNFSSYSEHTSVLIHLFVYVVGEDKCPLSGLVARVRESPGVTPLSLRRKLEQGINPATDTGFLCSSKGFKP